VLFGHRYQKIWRFSDITLVLARTPGAYLARPYGCPRGQTCRLAMSKTFQLQSEAFS
jgi:hypothetical protein